MLVFGSPTRTICEQAQKFGVDLIIMGNRGISNIEKIVDRSVISYVIENADCSVLIAPISDEKETNITWEKFYRVAKTSQCCNCFRSPFKFTPSRCLLTVPLDATAKADRDRLKNFCFNKIRSQY